MAGKHETTATGACCVPERAGPGPSVQPVHRFAGERAAHPADLRPPAIEPGLERDRRGEWSRQELGAARDVHASRARLPEARSAHAKVLAVGAYARARVHLPADRWPARTRDAVALPGSEQVRRVDEH